MLHCESNALKKTIYFLLCDLDEYYFLSLVYTLLKYELPLFVFSLNGYFVYVAQASFTFPM